MRPYTIINCAMSADGKIALPDKKPLRISGDKDIERMYNLRNKSDGILVGINTIINDNPKLTVKEKYVKKVSNPTRIVLDTKGRIPENSLVLNKTAKTFIITSKKCRDRTFGENIEIIKCSTDAYGKINLEELTQLLYKKDIKKLMVEGGGTVIWNFLKQKLVDEIYTYIAPFVIGGKSSPTMSEDEGANNINDLINLKLKSVKKVDQGILVHYVPQK
ncbi:MAG: 2,5-diamino-6-(ribosylamino)-4(3H)-pyrimidinone 5'-phosphate reductase [Candidatus Thermoplasmatota archaeon]